MPRWPAPRTRRTERRRRITGVIAAALLAAFVQPLAAHATTPARTPRTTWTEIKSMVAFRNATSGQSLTDRWDDGNDAIAVGRGGKGYVVINHESSSLSRTYRTPLPAGTYCIVQNNTSVAVNSSGQFTATHGANTALASYADKTGC